MGSADGRSTVGEAERPAIRLNDGPDLREPKHAKTKHFHRVVLLDPVF
jgi:hypothetical protein